MLTSIAVRNLGVIQEAELDLSSGSSALTGETGAGKTLVVSAALLLLGTRADRSLIRSGCEAASVEGRFLLRRDHPATEMLVEKGVLDPGEIRDDEVEIVVSRSIAAEARRNKVRLNGALVPLVLLEEFAGSIVEIAGQNEHTHVAARSFQRRLLDEVAGATGLAEDVATTVKKAAGVLRRAEELKREERERARLLDALRAEIVQIERVAPRPGEQEELETEVRRLERAEELTRGLNDAARALRDEGGAEEVLLGVTETVRELVEIEPALASAAQRLEAAAIEVGDVSAGLASLRSEAREGDLDGLRSRIAELRSLSRRFGATEADVLRYADEARARIEELEDADAVVESAEREAAALSEEATRLATKLGGMRRQAAAHLTAEVEARLTKLALAGARFAVDLTPCDLHEGGLERIEFLFTAEPGGSPAPLRQVASGGELARVTLALQLARPRGGTSTMIFDEVDAGVGGAAAAEVGKALADLGRTKGLQVVVVTHLPQVAAFADEHHVVSKTIDEGRAISAVRRVEGEERVAELSRMLAGLADSDAARTHARELLELALPGAPRG